MSKNGEEEKAKKLEVQSVGGGNATFLLIEIITFQSYYDKRMSGSCVAAVIYKRKLDTFLITNIILFNFSFIRLYHSLCHRARNLCFPLVCV